MVINPAYKILDALYLSLAQYAVLCEVLSIWLAKYFNKYLFEIKWFSLICGVWSLIMMIATVTITLQQRYVVRTFTDMYKVFADHPINEFEETERIREASIILISLEDRLYYERKGYTNYSFSVAKKIFDEHVQKTDIIKLSYLKYIMRTALSFLKKIIKNILLHDRGYSTIPMQLVRSLGLERGYNCAFRRKIYEVIYSRIFFEGLKNIMKYITIMEDKT